MAAIAPRRTLAQLLRQGYNEIPEVLLSTGIAVVGIAFGLIGVNRYIKNDGDNRRYKMVYTIMRPDDPRVKKIKKN